MNSQLLANAKTQRRQDKQTSDQVRLSGITTLSRTQLALLALCAEVGSPSGQRGVPAEHLGWGARPDRVTGRLCVKAVLVTSALMLTLLGVAAGTRRRKSPTPFV